MVAPGDDSKTGLLKMRQEKKLGSIKEKQKTQTGC